MTATYEQRKRYKEKIIKWYRELNAQQVCVCCGKPGEEDDPIEWHHPDPSSKRDNIARLVQQAHSIKTIMREVEKCVPMRHSCHAKLEGRVENGSEVSQLRTSTPVEVATHG